MKTPITVTVNDHLTLDAGRLECSSAGRDRIIDPPQPSMFRQVLDYLERGPTSAPPRLLPHEQARATTTLCLRWGTWMAVLLDPTKPADPRLARHREDNYALITAGEMRRINLEASAALADWIELRRQDETRYFALAHRALELLPPAPVRNGVLPLPELPVLKIVHKLGHTVTPHLPLIQRPATAPDKMETVAAYPTRTLANAFINYIWRNNHSTETAHTGDAVDRYSLAHRRFPDFDAGILFEEIGPKMLEGVEVLEKMMLNPGRDWVGEVRPFAQVELLLVTPTRWSLTDHSAAFNLP